MTNTELLLLASMLAATSACDPAEKRADLKLEADLARAREKQDTDNAAMVRRDGSWKFEAAGAGAISCSCQPVLTKIRVVTIPLPIPAEMIPKEE